MDEAQARTRLGVALRVGVFVFLAVAGLWIFSPLLFPIGGYLVAATLSTFAAAAVANALTLRIYERAHLADIGLYWSAASARNLALGFAGGAGSACLVLGLPLLAGAAELRTEPDNPANWGTFLFVSLVLLFGVVGEEMLFRGYGFQVLVPALGPFAAILPMSVLFGLAHAANQNFSPLGLANTIGWGVLFGYAFLRSGGLWLPIGLHFGWNWVLPLFGVNLSGFTMKIAGHAMHWKTSELWSGGNYGPEAGLLCCGVLVGLFFYLRKAPIQAQRSPLLGSLREA